MGKDKEEDLKEIKKDPEGEYQKIITAARARKGKKISPDTFQEESSEKGFRDKMDKIWNGR